VLYLHNLQRQYFAVYLPMRSTDPVNKVEWEGVKDTMLRLVHTMNISKRTVWLCFQVEKERTLASEEKVRCLKFEVPR
jgi:hypothetical protein